MNQEEMNKVLSQIQPELEKLRQISQDLLNNQE